MKTKELIEHLQKLDPTGNLTVIQTRCSDYCPLTLDEVYVVQGVPKPTAAYIMRAHETMSDADKAATRDFVHFDGN